MPSRRLRVVTIALLLLVRPPAAPAGDAAGAFAPYEDLTEVLATLAWHLNDDLYRFPPAKDPTGHDVFALSVERLQNWDTRFPSRLRDVTGYARGQALERLGEFGRAANAFSAVAGMADAPLAARARDAATRARAFADAAALPEDGQDMSARLAAIRRKLDAWNLLVQRHAGTPYQALALVEEERLERSTALLLVRHRSEIEHGDETAEKALRFLIEKHAESKDLARHVLALGDLQADIARDWLAAHDRPLEFDENGFIVRADRALDTYRKVATWDGAREKPEGEGRFAALDAWKASVLARYR